MKLQNIFLSGVLFLLQSTFIFAVPSEEVFQQGNKFFAQGQYVQACKFYERIENKGFAVLYNLGLSYLHQGKQAQAVLYAKRAEKQAGYQELTQLYELFDYMNQLADCDYAPGWYEQLAIFLKKCILSISILLIQISLLVVLILLILCWYRRLYRINVKLFLSMMLLCMTLFNVWWYKKNMMKLQVGIVTQKDICVFAGPDESFYKKSELHESDEVIIISKRQGYSQVKAKQLVGWIHDKDIELV